MAMRFAIAGFLLLGTCIGTQALTQPCQEDFGTNLPNPISDDSSLGLLLDLENRAECSGTVTAYHYCYYDIIQENVMVVFFMVFRESGNEYTLVEGSRRRVTRTDAEVNGFGCDVEQLSEAQQFQVQENDIIAACTVDTSSRRPLRVHASSGGEDLYELEEFDVGDTDSCAELSTISGLKKRDNFALHLYADIEVEVPSTSSIDMDDEVTSTAQQSESLAMSTGIGTPIPSSSVVDLDDEVTSTAQQTESPAMSTGIGTPIPSSSVVDMDDEVTSTAQQSESAAISTRGLATESPSPLSTGAASSPPVSETAGSRMSTMPVVYTTSSATDQESINPTSTFTSERTSTLSKLQMVPSSSTGSNPFTSARETADPSVEARARSSGGNDGGPNVAAIVVPLLLILIGVSVGIVFVIVLVIARRKNSGKFTPSGQIQGSTPFAMDNAVYALDNSTEPVYEDTYEKPNHEHVSRPVYELEEFPAPPLPPVDYGEYAEAKDTYLASTTYSESYYSTINSHTDYGQLLEQSKEEDIYGYSSPYHTPAASEDELYAELKSYGIKSIPKLQIEITGHLGSGQFGNVEKGIWATPYGIVDVAVKTLSADGDKVKFLQEAAIMAQFKHPNVVLLHGVVCEDKPVCKM